MILGICVLVWPGISILVAATLFGVYLLITGIAQAIFAFALDVSAGARILLFISGAASLILAVLLLAIWIGVGFIFRGTATLVAAISERGLRGRGWLIFYGVISLIAGVVVWAWPFDSIVVLAITIGVWLVIMGGFEIVSAFGIRKDANKIANFRRQFGRQTLKDSKGAAPR